jgi:RNA polymerase sigma factor (sigma-70 family)
LRAIFDEGTVAGLDDGQLLERFASRRGAAAEAAFAALVERHGPMVLRACRAILRDDHDAHDAFQATFLALVRRGGTLWVRDSLAPWLHRVARRLAIRAKAASRRRAEVERGAAALSRVLHEIEPPDDRAAIVHEEIDNLPATFRRPVVLCDLEGRSYDDAAALLGCPVGTVKSRLARGRSRLKSRLERRGLAPAFALPAASAARAAIPESLVAATARGAASLIAGQGAVGAVPAAVLALWRSERRSVFMIKLKAAAILAVGCVLVGAGAYQGAGARPSDPDQAGTKVAAAPKPAEARDAKPAASISAPHAGDLDEEVKKILQVAEIAGGALAVQHRVKLIEEEMVALSKFLKEHNFGIPDPAREPAEQERIAEACEAAEKKVKDLTSELAALGAAGTAAELVQARYQSQIRKVAGDDAPPPPDLDRRLKDVEQKLDRVLKALEARSAAEPH